MDSPAENADLNLFDYVAILVKWRKWLVINVFSVCVLTTIAVFVVPKWYKATVTILPPQGNKGFGLSALFNNLPFGEDLSFLRTDLLQGNASTMTYLAILKSRTVMDLMIDRFDLVKVYAQKDREKTLKLLRQNVDIELDKEGAIAVTVLDRDPYRVAAMANTFAYYLDSLHVELNIKKARANRIFIEQRFKQNTRDLRKAEEQLKAFQERHGIIELSEQIKMAIEEAAELTTLATTTEIALQVKEHTLSPTHSDIIHTRRELAALQSKINDIQFGSSREFMQSDSTVETDRFFIPFVHLPKLSMTYARLLRDLGVQTKLYEFLIQQYEQAKIEEAKDIPIVQLLDKAVVPLRKAKPMRLLTILIASLMSFLLTSLFIFTKEFFQRIETGEGRRAVQLQWIKQEIRSEITRFFHR